MINDRTNDCVSESLKQRNNNTGNVKVSEASDLKLVELSRMDPENIVPYMLQSSFSGSDSASHVTKTTRNRSVAKMICDEHSRCRKLGKYDIEQHSKHRQMFNNRSISVFTQSSSLLKKKNARIKSSVSA